MSVLRQFKLKLFSVSVESNPMNDVVGWASFAMADWMNSNYFVIGNWKVKKKQKSLILYNNYKKRCNHNNPTSCLGKFHVNIAAVVLFWTLWESWLSSNNFTNFTTLEHSFYNRSANTVSIAKCFHR